MKQTKSLGIAVTLTLLVTMVLAACSQQESPTKPQAASTSTAEAQAEKPKFKFTDTNGEHTLATAPVNIATTVTYLTDHMIALGLMPKATVKSQNEDFPLYLKPYLDKVDIIGEQGNVQIEKLLSLSPDLIITDTNSSKIYEQYAKLAPTAMLENGYGAPSWRKHSALQGKHSACRRRRSRSLPLIRLRKNRPLNK